MKKIVILDAYGVNPGDMDWQPVAALGSLTTYDRTSRDEIAERCAGAEIVLTNKVPFDAATIESLDACKYIGVLATGYNLIDLDAARKKGIVVTNIPAYSTDSVAQNVFALLLAITNHVEEYSIRNRQGRWAQCKDFCYLDFPLMELSGKRMGIVGFGNIGQAVARIARAFGMNVGVYSSKPQEKLPEVRKMSMDEIFSECDVVSLHCPLAPDTRNLVDARRLAMMKPTAILINTGRGPLVDEQALADALNSGKIYAAGLDVLSTEPPKADNPLLTARNCFITPHISWASTEARVRLIDIAAHNIAAYLEGRPVNVVD